MQNVENEKLVQAIDDNIYFQTIEYRLIVFVYDLQSSSLTLVDQLSNNGSYLIINNDLVVTLQFCNYDKSFVLYSRKQKANQVLIVDILQDESISSTFLAISKQYLKLVFKVQFAIGFINLKIIDLQTFKFYQIEQTTVIASNEQNFIASYLQQYIVYNFIDLSTFNLQIPFSIVILNFNLLQIQNKTFMMIQNIQKQVFMYNLTGQQITQLVLQASTENNYSLIKQEQVMLFQSANIINKYIIGQNYQQINIQCSDFYQSAMQFQSSTVLICQNQMVFFDFNTNEQILSDFSNNPDGLAFVSIVRDRQLLAKIVGQYVVLDLQLNIKHTFLNQTQVLYIPEIDVFISSDQNNQIILHRRIDYKSQKLNLFFTNIQQQLSYEAVIESKNSIIITAKEQYTQISYLYNYFTNQISQLQFQDMAYYNSFNKYYLYSQDDIIIIFLKVSYTIIQILENGQYEILKYQSLSQNFLQFDNINNLGQIFYNNQNKLIIQLYIQSEGVNSQGKTILTIYDLDLIQKCQYTFLSIQQYLHVLKDSVKFNSIIQINFFPIFKIHF
ncbi:hypothetical protein TTHERM_000629798 (macronuclear) [Tetrahymena thermophila SB210]|uniref:Uncharacterized protein n=1 Tax=Tetrahymena thermophila (strain SB210) TaxID=312017 RepID=W7X826_TETTS|nr:hypothetical protein TTHERM_000629798 [Tetrahymena thermophila SB210]EWS72578.1 hypothetical protein TTHERM_000629798 [Tetrahymena thermophila SB210]|eukprot:XP_012654861.1 hypothetical protein TTHERM_000629798 [Tetrahymena thermophila SB210]